MENYLVRQHSNFEKQLAKDGIKSLLSSQKTLTIRLEEHTAKLLEINKNGGYTSSVEREIRTIKSQLEAIKHILRKK